MPTAHVPCHLCYTCAMSLKTGKKKRAAWSLHAGCCKCQDEHTAEKRSYARYCTTPGMPPVDAATSAILCNTTAFTRCAFCVYQHRHLSACILTIHGIHACAMFISTYDSSSAYYVIPYLHIYGLCVLPSLHLLHALWDAIIYFIIHGLYITTIHNNYTLSSVVLITSVYSNAANSLSSIVF